MEPESRIYVAGHGGLVGSALVRRLQADDYRQLVLRSRHELDLTDAQAVDAFFRDERPEYVFLAAARVGGIAANTARPVEFLRDNLLIQTHVIDAARRSAVRKLLMLGSSCIYPRDAPQPLREEYLLSGPLEPTNEAYAVAKIAGVKLCAACNRQYGTAFLSVMPTNVYGPGADDDPETSHVVPALLRRFHEAKLDGTPEVVVWGTGTPRRELMHVDDLADACLMLMRDVGPGGAGDWINVGTGEDCSIAELATTIADVVGYRGELRFDTTRPDGMPRKLLDVSRIHALGWRHRIDLRPGLERTYAEFLDRESGVRDTRREAPKRGALK